MIKKLFATAVTEWKCLTLAAGLLAIKTTKQYLINVQSATLTPIIAKDAIIRDMNLQKRGGELFTKELYSRKVVPGVLNAMDQTVTAIAAILVDKFD